MSNASSCVTSSRGASLAGAAIKPVFRERKAPARSGSCKLRRCEPNHLVKTQGEVLGTEAFQDMFVTSRQQFVAMAYSIVRNTEDAEDAVHNAFISGYLHLCNFQGRSALKTWFTRVVLNAALMVQRKRKVVHLISAMEWASDEGGQWMDAIPSPQPDPEMCCAKAEELGVIHEVSGQLKPRLREAFSMFYGNAMTVREARDMVGVSTGTFKARLFRARRQVISEARHALVRPQKEGALTDSPPRLSSSCAHAER